MVVPYWPADPTPPIPGSYEAIAFLLAWLMLLAIFIGLSLSVGLFLALRARDRGRGLPGRGHRPATR